MLSDKNVTQRTAYLLLSRGRKLPEYLATLKIADRAICLKAIDSVNRLPESMYVALLAYPERFAREMPKDTALLFDMIAEKANEVIQQWSPEELAGDIDRIIKAKEKWDKVAEMQKGKAALN